MASQENYKKRAQASSEMLEQYPVRCDDKIPQIVDGLGD